ncbi:MAG: serpin family protein [Bacteroidales bacterium]|nr:serpin family protein [Bacteroidales bacterium]
MKKLQPLLLAVLMTALLFSCDKEQNQPKPFDLTLCEQKVLEQGNQFGFDLFTLLGKENPDSNLCISPYSLYTCLAMVANGAGSQTLDELLNLLGFSEMGVSDLNKTVKNLDQTLIGIDPATVFETANSCWYDVRKFNVYDNFKSNLVEYYSAKVAGADFSNSLTLPEINGWVKDNTHGKIDEIMDAVSPQDICYLINVLYFNGTWTKKFNRKFTFQYAFQVVDGSVEKVPTMYKSDTLNVINTGALQAVELPYGDGSWSMYLFLPKTGVNLDDWCSQQLSVGWSDVRSQFKLVEGQVIYLPQFKIKSSIVLNDQLRQMGIPSAFSANADFSKLGPGSISLSKVLQKTYIDVNEDGTEAAAASEGVFSGSGPISPIRFDHPFIFVIAEKSTGSIIFLGKVMNPLTQNK